MLCWGVILSLQASGLADTPAAKDGKIPTLAGKNSSLMKVPIVRCSMNKGLAAAYGADGAEKKIKENVFVLIQQESSPRTEFNSSTKS